VWERPHFASPEQNHADSLPCPQERDAQAGTPTQPQRELATFRVFFCLGLHVGNVVRASLYDGSTVEEATHERYLVLTDRVRERYLPMMRDETQGAAVHLKNRRVESIAQASRSPLSLRRRAAGLSVSLRSPSGSPGGGLLLPRVG
jgi:hypothetical protein